MATLHRVHRPELPDVEQRALSLVPTRPGRQRIAAALITSLVVVTLLLKFTPYQQTITGNGKVGVYSVMERPQTIDAQIGGRIITWNVEEGQAVKKGQLLAVIQDTEARYLSPERVALIQQQLQAQRARRASELQRIVEIEGQITSLRQSQPQQVEAAGRRQEQAKNSRAISQKQVAIAEDSLRRVREVVRLQVQQRVLQAELRLQQAKDRLTQAQQVVRVDTIALENQRLQRGRIASLFTQGLRSQRQDELEQQALVGAEAKLEQSKKAVEIVNNDIQAAQKELAIVKATTIDADIQVQQVRNQVLQAREGERNAVQQIGIAGNDRLQRVFDTDANIRSAEANLQSIRAAVAGLDREIASFELELQNMQERVAQQKIYSPLSGRVARIGKNVGPGQTVKKDEELLELVPETLDQAVELVLSGFDAPLVTVGRPVRLQFNGFPAVQVQGFPQAAVGTFAGVVHRMDPDDDGSGRVRVWILPDATKIEARQEKAWPSSARLRPGTDTVGWVLLDTVPLWYELWRQFNAFPPNFRDMALEKKDKSGEDSDKTKKLKPMKDGDVKLPKR